MFGFVFTIGALPFYCEIFVTFFTSMGGFERARLSIFIVLFWTCLTVISKQHKKVALLCTVRPNQIFISSNVEFTLIEISQIGDELYKWLYLKGNYIQLTESDLNLLLHDLALNNLGLSAGNSLVITFGLMSSVRVSYTLVL